MNTVGKIYRFKNGRSVAKCECYDGYTMQYFWMVFNCDGSPMKKAKSFTDAAEIARRTGKGV